MMKNPLQQHWHSVSSFGLSLLLYLYTMPKVVALEDDGLFIQAAMSPGLAHPPGYPLFVLSGWLLQQIPGISPAIAMHSLSAMFAAISVALVATLVFKFTAHRGVAMSTALLFGSGQVFWSQAIIADVYTLNTVFVLTLVWLRYQDWRTSRQLQLAALIFGLSLCNHIPLMLLLAPALLWLYWPLLQQNWQKLPLLALLLVLGFSPNLLMIPMSQTADAFVAYGPIRNLNEWLGVLLRSPNSSADHGTYAQTIDKFKYLGFVAWQLLLEYAVVGWLLLIPAWGVLKQHHRSLLVFLLLAFAGNYVLLTLLLGFEYNALQREVIKVYYLPVLALWSVALGVGLKRFLGCLEDLPRLARLVVMAGLPLGMVWSYWAQNDRHAYDWSTRYFSILQQLVPPGADLIVQDDVNTGTVGYLNLMQPDDQRWQMYNVNGLGFANRFVHPLDIEAEQQRAWIESWQGNQQAYFTYDVPLTLGKSCRWLVCQYDQNVAEGQVRQLFDSASLQALQSILELAPKDPWSKIHHELLLARAIPWLLPLYQKAEGEQKQQLKRLILKLSDSPSNLLALLDNLLGTANLEEFFSVEEFSLFLELNPTELAAEKQAWYLFRLAHWLKLQGRDYAPLYQRSLQIYPHPGKL